MDQQNPKTEKAQLQRAAALGLQAAHKGTQLRAGGHHDHGEAVFHRGAAGGRGAERPDGGRGEGVGRDHALAGHLRLRRAGADLLVVVVRPYDRSVAIRLLDLALRVRRALRVEVADGDDAGDVGTLENAGYLEGVRDASAADDCDVYLAIGTEAARAAVEKDRGSPGGDDAAKEVTTIDAFHDA